MDNAQIRSRDLISAKMGAVRKPRAVENATKFQSTYFGLIQDAMDGNRPILTFLTPYGVDFLWPNRKILLRAVVSKVVKAYNRARGPARHFKEQIGKIWSLLGYFSAGDSIICTRFWD